jgi:hypothetical protein
MSQPKASFHKGIFAVPVQIAQAAVSQHQVHKQDHGHFGQPDDKALVKMCEASLEAAVNSNMTEEGLNKNDSSMGCQSLILESQLGEPIDTGVNLCSAGFHLWWPPG